MLHFVCTFAIFHFEISVFPNRFCCNNLLSGLWQLIWDRETNWQTLFPPAHFIVNVDDTFLRFTISAIFKTLGWSHQSLVNICSPSPLCYSPLPPLTSPTPQADRLERRKRQEPQAAGTDVGKKSLCQVPFNVHLPSTTDCWSETDWWRLRW